MSDWGKGAQNNTIGWGQSSTNSIGYGSIYETSYAGDTALIGTSAAFLYSKSSFNQGEADPTPTITGTAGGSFNASANVVFVDTGTYNSSTGQIDLSATSIGSHIITYTVNGVQSGQTVGVESIPYASTSSFTFDGINDYFDCGDSDTFSFGNGSTDSPFSFFIWAKFGNITTNCFISKQTNDTTNSEYQFWQSGDSMGITFAEGVGTRTGYLASSTTVSPSLTTGQWYHIGFTYAGGSNPSTGPIIYVNGVAQSMSYNISSYTAMSNNSASLKIGELSGASGTYNFNGNLDEASIWNTALSQNAITEIASGPNDLTSLSNASNTNLKAWYKF